MWKNFKKLRDEAGEAITAQAKGVPLDPDPEEASIFGRDSVMKRRKNDPIQQRQTYI